MGDKVQKILSEITTRKLCTMDEHMAFYNDKAKEDYRLLSEIEEVIKALQEEHVSEKKCMFTKDSYTEEDRKVLCDGCEEECKYAQTKETAIEDLELEEEITKCYKSRIDLMMTRKQFGEIIHRFTKWQKQQMMKDVTEVTVHMDAGGYPYIPQIELYDYDKDAPLAKEGDKYKVILIKE